jgi:hypothetical protein
MIKKLIPIALMVVVGAVCFLGSMFAAKTFRAMSGKDELGDGQVVIQADQTVLDSLATANSADLKPREQLLDDLIKEVRVKMNDLDRRQRDLDERENRLQLSADQLKRKAQELEQLRIELVSAMTPLKAERAQLMKYRTLIESQEVENLQNTAKMWSKMDPAAAARLIIEMFQTRKGDDATKIIYYLDEKSWAAIMDEIRETGTGVEIIQRQIRVVSEK